MTTKAMGDSLRNDYALKWAQTLGYESEPGRERSNRNRGDRRGV